MFSLPRLVLPLAVLGVVATPIPALFQMKLCGTYQGVYYGPCLSHPTARPPAPDEFLGLNNALFAAWFDAHGIPNAGTFRWWVTDTSDNHTVIGHVNGPSAVYTEFVFRFGQLYCCVTDAPFSIRDINNHDVVVGYSPGSGYIALAKSAENGWQPAFIPDPRLPHFGLDGTMFTAIDDRFIINGEGISPYGPKFSLVPIPEPAPVFLTAVGLMVLACRRRCSVRSGFRGLMVLIVGSGSLLLAQDATRALRDTTAPAPVKRPGGSPYEPVSKLDPRLNPPLAYAGSSRIPVLIYLAHQPIERLQPAIEQQYASRLANAESLLANAVRKRDPRTAAASRETINELTLGLRRDLISALRAAQRPSQEELERTLTSIGATRIEPYAILNLIRADVPTSALAALEADPRIAEIGLDAEQTAQLDTSAPALGAPVFWLSGFTGAGLSVLVLDSGITGVHPAFTNRVRAATFLSNPTCPPNELISTGDFNGHGTHVSGIIASAGTPAFPNHLGVAFGVSTLYSAKISCDNGRSFTSDTLRAVEVALQLTPIEIVNNSNGGTTLLDDDSFSRRIDELVDNYNLTWVNAAGNGGPGPRTVGSPGIAYNAISVAAMDTRGTTDRAQSMVAGFSSRGPTLEGRFKPDVAAPGVGIVSARHDSPGFVSMQGTSMAAPHVAGAAVLLRQAGVPGRLVKALLINTTDTVGWRPDRGWGYVNLGRALDQAGYLLSGNLSTTTGSFVLFRATVAASRDLFATLAWNRYVRGGASFLRDLDFVAYRASDGQILVRSVEERQNVEQVSVARAAAATPIVLKVLGFNDGAGFTEPFAISVSEPGFQIARGPAFAINCSVPNPVVRNSSITVACTVRNDGDLPAFNVAVQAGFVGLTAAPARGLGTLIPGASATGSFTLTSPGTTGNASLSVTVLAAAYGELFPASESFTVVVQAGPGGSLPAISAGGVLHGASFRPGITSGTWVSILGTNLSNMSRSWQASDFVDGRLPTSLDGVRVNINGRPAFVYFISPTQINVLAPDDPTEGFVPVEVITVNGRSNTITAQKVRLAPAFFLFDPGGRRYPAAVHPDGAFLAPAGLFPGGFSHRPARPNDLVLLYGTGCGPTNPATPSDRVVAVPSPLARTASVTVGGRTAEVLFAGVVGSGLCQVNVRIPDGVADGDQGVTLTIDGVNAPSGVFIPVRR